MTTFTLTLKDFDLTPDVSADLEVVLDIEAAQDATDVAPGHAATFTVHNVTDLHTGADLYATLTQAQVTELAEAAEDALFHAQLVIYGNVATSAKALSAAYAVLRGLN